jgi:hypothetical protein
VVRGHGKRMPSKLICITVGLIALSSCNYAMAQTTATPAPDTLPIIQGITLDNSPSVMVKSNSNVQLQQGINLNLSVLHTFRIFSQPKSQPYLDPMQPRCKANWNTGGRTCWYDY